MKNVLSAEQKATQNKIHSLMLLLENIVLCTLGIHGDWARWNNLLIAAVKPSVGIKLLPSTVSVQYTFSFLRSRFLVPRYS
jgi:hypothetical protein